MFTKKRLINPAKSFKSQFRVRITPPIPSPPATHGLRDSPGPKGRHRPRHRGGSGYADIDPSLAVELDIYQNFDHGDPNGNHIAVHLNGNSSAAEETATPTFSLIDGPTSVWIQYAGVEAQAQDLCGTGQAKPSNPLITYHKKLTEICFPVRICGPDSRRRPGPTSPSRAF